VIEASRRAGGFGASWEGRVISNSCFHWKETLIGQQILETPRKIITQDQEWSSCSTQTELEWSLGMRKL
jgi:hypothetical protein